MTKEEKIDWDLHDIASKINAQVVATTAALNDAWRNELNTLKLPNGVLNKLWLETAYFGAYLLEKRFSAPLGEQKSKEVNKYVRDGFLLIVPSTFSDGDNENEEFKKWIASEYDRTLEMYENYKGVDVKALFRDLVRDIFNTTEDSKMKFIDNTFWTRLKLKIAFFLAALGGNKEFMEKHGNEVYLPHENLTACATSAAQAFAAVSENDIHD